jgi:hypothetical protein
MTFNTELCSGPNYPCVNPCPNILAPQATGYSNNPYKAGSTLTYEINMQAVTTAIAVNMGMLQLSQLQNV